MLHSLSKSSKSTEPKKIHTSSANGETANAAIISTHEVLFTTAATIHRRPSVIELLHTITHIHRHPHPHHPDCQHIEPSYFEAARMARHMTHL